MIYCLVLVNKRDGHCLLPFYRNRRYDNGCERWAAYEFNTREDIDVLCLNGKPALIDHHPDGQWYKV